MTIIMLEASCSASARAAVNWARIGADGSIVINDRQPISSSSLPFTFMYS